MSGTVNYSDEDKLLTSDEFIAAAKQNADKNLQIQKDTAQKVYDSTYASLDRQYNEAAAAAGVAKERNLIDADTAYQRQEMKYGAEQEALAAAGLSGSGMNEYRRAQSYQKNREDRQMSYAEYDRALREANYTRDQGKLAADITKIQSDAAAEMHYNDTMTGIAEKELGYADLERQEIDAAYSGYLAGIEDGSLTLDQIMADSSWAKLSTEQQTAVNRAWTVKGFKDSIDNGTYADEDELKASTEFEAIENDTAMTSAVLSYFASYHAGKCASAEAAISDYWTMALNGASEEDLIAAATAAGHYEALKDTDGWKALVDKTKETTTITNIENAIADGATLEEIQNMPGYNELDGTDKSNIEQAVNDRDEEAEVEVDAIVTELVTEGAMSAQDLEDYFTINKVPESARAEIISRYQGEMANRTIASINDGSAFNGENALTGAALAENIKNGVYGDQGEQVATEFITFMLSVLQDPDADINDATDVRNMISGLKDYVSDDLWAKASAALGHKDTWWKYSNDAVFEGVPVKLGNEIIDSRTLSSLERYKSKHTKNQVITFNGNMYYRDGDKWWALEKDTSRPTGLITVDWISNSEYKLETGVKWSYNGDKKIALKDSESEALNNMFPDSTTGNVATINGIRYGKDGSGKWWRIK